MNPGLYCKHSSKKREVKSSNIFYYQNNNTPKITNSINTNLGLININKISDIETGLAQSMAMSALVQPQYGKSNFSIATGNYNGTSAIAYGFYHHDSNQDITYRLLGSQSGNISSSAASVDWSF
jgi:autotransporter adhesin